MVRVFRIFPSNFIHLIPCMPEATEWVEHLFQQRWEYQLDYTRQNHAKTPSTKLRMAIYSHVLHLLFSLYAHHKCFGYSGHELMSQYGWQYVSFGFPILIFTFIALFHIFCSFVCPSIQLPLALSFFYILLLHHL